jgi:hypothetical protein
MLFILSYGECESALRSGLKPLSRETPEILPYCPFCGKYKGVGPCKNQDCRGAALEELRKAGARPPIQGAQPQCIICGADVTHRCARCTRGYCHDHSEGHSSLSLTTVKQRLGRCSICGQIVCEHCWLLDESGRIVCLQHRIDASSS